MGFHLYQSTSDAASGMQELHYIKPVRLSGEHGLIAHFIRAHPHEDLADWELKLEEIASITVNTGIRYSADILLPTRRRQPVGLLAGYFTDG